MRISFQSVIAVASLSLAVGLLTAGPLNPPAGAVTSTYKTLSEIEPRTAINATNTPGDADSIYRITQPGGYYLTGNITLTTGKSGIEVASSPVTIDLNGFRIFGLGTITNSLDGVVAVPGSVVVTLKNGGIYGAGLDAVNFSTVDHATVENVYVYNALSDGIVVNDGSRVINCTARTCADAGFKGYNAQFIGCTAQNCGDYGFDIYGAGTLSDCIAVSCGLYGFDLGDGSTARNSIARQNNTGFYCSNAATLENCTAELNSTGFDGGYDSVLRGCIAKYNSFVGINSGFGTTVVHCTAGANTGDGIRVGNDCLILENNCWSNGFQTGDGAGIHCFNGNNRIEGNTCTTNDRGIETDDGACLIIRNALRSNTANWALSGTNTVGPSVTSATIGTSTNPHANYTY